MLFRSLFFVLPFLTACASLSGGGSSKPVEIALKGKPGDTRDTRYRSKSSILTYTGGQLVRDRKETLDFVVRNQVLGSGEGILSFQSSTVDKDGPGNLHDLAFPELLETIEYLVKSSGEVLKAGSFPPSSIFFVPSVPVPRDPVAVGDTWTLEHIWRSAHDGVPLRLEVAAILKDVIPCDGGGYCADLEISGHVKLVLEPDAADARFVSRLWGRMLFSLERGDVIWSQTRSFEDVSHAKGRVVVSSCMTSEMKVSAEYKAPYGCEPGDLPVSQVPRL